MYTIGQSIQNSFKASNCFYNSGSKSNPHHTYRTAKLAKDLTSSHKTVSNAVLESSKKYSESIRTSRQKTKDASLSVKKLKYQFKSISSKILRSKTSSAARQAESEARREYLRLKRQKQNEGVDAEELDAAMKHAKAMERIAKKKVRHLVEEELAKSTGGPCAGDQIEDENDELRDDSDINDEYSDEDLMENNYFDEDEFINEEYIDAQFSEMNSLFSDLDELTTELFEEFSEGMREMLEDMGLDELSDSLMSSKGDMDPADLEEMKIKHRNKEMKEIVKADADYLKAMFDHYQKLLSSGGEGVANAMPAPVISAVSDSMPAPVIDISL